ncbi:MAG: hypothetical protein Q9210_000075 [Variospora velana]
MSASQPLTSAFEPPSAEDPMDFYPDQDNRSPADDGIDIDLDFSTEPPQDIDDDEKFEQPELGVGQTEYLDSDPAHDEPMADETGVDDGIPLDTFEDAYHGPDENLDEFSGEPHDRPAMCSAPTKDLSRDGQSQLATTSQSRTQQTAQRHGYADSPTDSGQEVDASGALDGTQVMKLTYKTKSVWDERTFRRQRLQGTLGDPQVVGPDDPSRPTRIEESAEESPNAVSESAGKSELLAANTYSAGADHDAIPSGENAWSHVIPLEASACRNEFSTFHMVAQADGTLPTIAESHDSKQGLDSGMATQRSHSQDVNSCKESPHSHAVLITYQENEMFLFPPAAEDQDNNQTYFLTDEALAAKPIDHLLQECRHVLEGSISENEELEVGIDALGLRLCESTADASTISLTRILEVFLQLHHHDGNGKPPPMNMTLSTRFQFSRRFEYLTDLVAEGKGISQLGYEDPSAYSGSSEELQETSEATEDPAADIYATEPNQIPPHEDDGQDELSTEDSTAQVFTQDTHNSINPSTSGERQLNVINTPAIPPDVSPSSSDDTHLANDHITSITNSTSSGPIHKLYETEEFSGDRSNQEEGYGTKIHYEEDDDNNRNSSNGSSTIQGDEAVATDVKVAIWERAAAYDVNLTPTEQFLTDIIGDEANPEDLITYEDDEEDEIDSAGASSSRTTEGLRQVAAGFPGSRYVDPVNVAKVLPRDAFQNGDDDSHAPLKEDVKARTVDRDEADSRGFSVDELGVGSRSGPDCTKDRTRQSGEHVPNDQANILHYLGLPGTHQKLDIGLNVFESDAANATAQHNVLSAKDDDEINYDDETIDEAETEALAEASPDVALNQPLPLSSSPGALKRPRATDDDVTLSGTDTKRVRPR